MDYTISKIPDARCPALKNSEISRWGGRKPTALPCRARSIRMIPKNSRRAPVGTPLPGCPQTHHKQKDQVKTSTSLRGGRSPTWQSPGTSYNFQDSFRRLPRPDGLAMTGKWEAGPDSPGRVCYFHASCPTARRPFPTSIPPVPVSPPNA